MELVRLVEDSMSLTLSQHEKDIDVAGLTADSRHVAPGYLFAALSGTNTDGALYAREAIEKGAVAVLCSNSAFAELKNEPAVIIPHDNPRMKLAEIAARFYPRQPKSIAAVTGTNGKTSIASFARQIWASVGLRAASMGTLGVVWQGGQMDLGHTTPDPIAVHKSLDTLATNGITHLALEASSHGLAQHRLDGVKLSAAAFSNLTRDHLDYHESEEAYRYAKFRLFGELLPPGRTAVLNADSDAFEELEDLCWGRGHRIMSIGREGRDIRLEALTPTRRGQSLQLRYRGQPVKLDIPLVGSFQVENTLLALGLVIACGTPASDAFSAVERLEGVPGRLEHVLETASHASVYVDYAHTPDALSALLMALRPHTERRLHVVFGCGGDRDRGKRFLMGEVASRYADEIIITDDNPRTEDATEIRAEIKRGAPQAKDVGDRSEAIRQALKALGPGDLLVVAGKGHEAGQIFRDRTIDFDDRAEVSKAAMELRLT